MDCSVIIVNFNTKAVLRSCLNSVRKTISGLSYETIVVDNASTDGSVEMIGGEFPEVVLIRNSVNKGFAAANNQALRIMKGRYALLLNSDTVLTADSVRRLFCFMETREDAAMACGQLLNEDGSKQNSIAAFPTLLTLIINTSLLEYLFPKRYPSKRHEIHAPVEIESAVGACILVRKKAIGEVGPLDERFFFFFEETDWALRMRKAGWKSYFVPNALIYHLQGRSIGHGGASRIQFYRSRYQYIRKWSSRFYFGLAACVIFLKLIVNWTSAALANVFSLGASRKLRNRFAMYSRVLLWHLRCCPPR